MEFGVEIFLDYTTRTTGIKHARKMGTHLKILNKFVRMETKRSGINCLSSPFHQEELQS
jgi:hypothetical protein